MAKYRWLLPALMTTTSILMLVPVLVSAAEDENNVYSPCEDTKVKKSDGFSFGIAFASTAESFSRNQVELSPCDSQLGLPYNAKVVVFRPYVDEISLLTVNTSSFQEVFNGMYMVAFAGRKYAARSLPTFVGNYTYIVTSFTLVLEFQKGTLQNLYWNKDGCSACSRSVDYSCLNDQECALQTSKCSQPEKTHDCNLSIQLAFSDFPTVKIVLTNEEQMKDALEILFQSPTRMKISVTVSPNRTGRPRRVTF